MTALSKFMVLLAIFLSASHANAFTSLSSVAGNQVWDIHLIQLQQPMSNPTNKPSCESIRKPTKRMDLDAELPTNLSQKKSWVAYREPKQDAELPSEITDLTNTQMLGLCHNNQSEPESFADKPSTEQEINHPKAPANDYSQIWQMPTTINLDSSGLSHATTMTNQNAHLLLGLTGKSTC